MKKLNHYNPITKKYTHSSYGEILLPNATEIEIFIPLEHAMFIGSEWIDFRDSEEILDKKKQIYLEKIGTEVTKLNRFALRKAIGKESEKHNYLTDTDLNNFKTVLYPQKKQLAEVYLSNGTITDYNLFDSMYNTECQKDFEGEKLMQEIDLLNSIEGVNIPKEGLTRMELFCHIVIVKFSLGNMLYFTLIMIIESFRIISLNRLDNLDFKKIDDSLILIQKLYTFEKPEDLLNLKNQIIEL